ncbi:MAG: hypothetical protein ACI4V1_06055 [Eubacteriales bacterium]
MNDHELQNSSSDRKYRLLMTEAYPQPKTDIRQAVMDRIAEEEKQSRKKRKFRPGQFLRFGSMAACLVLLLLLGVRILPAVTQEAATHDSAELNAEKATVFTSGSTEAVTFQDAAGTAETYAVEEGAAAEEAVREEAAVEEAVEEEAVLEEAVEAPAPAPTYKTSAATLTEEAEEDAEAEEDLLLLLPETEEDAIADADGGESYLCGYAGSYLTSNYASFSGDDSVEVPSSLTYTSEDCPHSGVFRNSFHDIPKSVMNLVRLSVDEETLAEWYAGVAGTCGMNIYELLTVFEIPQEQFEQLYTSSDLWYHHDYDVSLLYSGDRDAVCDYYRSGGSCERMAARYFEYELKLDLFAEAGSSAYAAWTAERGYTAIAHWSIAEFVRDFEIPRERFAALYDALCADFHDMYPDLAPVVYDLDKIYEMDSDVAASIASGAMGYRTDALCHME